jgi:hypothetical protein
MQLYEKFRKCRSIPASNFHFSPYQELSAGYYNFQSDRQKLFFSLDKRRIEAKTTMPYFLCTDHAQAIFRVGDKVFSKHLNRLFLDEIELSSNDINEMISDGLSSLEKDWCGKSKNNQVQCIREYRPLLDRKQKRVLHDELESCRHEWIQTCHKRECSVLFQFDPGSSVLEYDIDRWHCLVILQNHMISNEQVLWITC